ncbi:MAG: hypothetical protein FWC41_07955, partial [Firmicutes bacterium]|nr:hypothetical protein [Bacillota bacterium]
ELAIEAEGQEINPRGQNIINGKFTPKLETMLSGLVEHEEMSEIKRLLMSANLIKTKIKPKLENKTMGKTIIISERQAKMLSLLKLEDNAKKGEPFGDKPKNAGYVADKPTSGTGRAPHKGNKSASSSDAGTSKSGKVCCDPPKGTTKFTPNDYKSQNLKNAKEKSLIVNGNLNDYFVKEGVEYYQVTTKKDLLNQLMK